MMKTKSLFMNVAISLAILTCGIVIGKYLLSNKPETPKIKQYEYVGEIKTTHPPKEPLDHRFTSIKEVNKFGVVPDAATAYIIAKAILRATYGTRDDIDYSIPFTIKLQDDNVWSVHARCNMSTFTAWYNIAIDKRDGHIVNLSAEI